MSEVQIKIYTLQKFSNYHYLKQWTEYQVRNIYIVLFETVHEHKSLIMQSEFY